MGHKVRNFKAILHFWLTLYIRKGKLTGSWFTKTLYVELTKRWHIYVTGSDCSENFPWLSLLELLDKVWKLFEKTPDRLIDESARKSGSCVQQHVQQLVLLSFCQRLLDNQLERWSSFKRTHSFKECQFITLQFTTYC